MQTLTELAAELLITDQAFAPAAPGFVGTAVDLPGTVPGRRHLRHGFLATRAPGVVTVSGPPSPGIAAAVARMTDDLRVATVAADGGDPGAAGVRVAVEAGLEGGGPHGLVDRWRLAHTLGPVLAAAFANAPGHGWRSVRQARHRDRPVVPAGGPDPWTAWAGAVLDAPAGPRAETVGTVTVPHTPPHGWSFRQWTRATPRPSLSDLAGHVDRLRLPVTARGHLEIDVADRQPGAGWQVVVAVTAVLLDDPRAAAVAGAATAGLADEPRLWERAARDALTDPVLAAAARECFLAAYGALARQGVPRDLRNAVAGFTERYVLRRRCPADDATRQERSPVM